MSLYRVKQFFRATLDNFKSISIEDLSILKTYLSHELIKVFYDMNKMDQHHCLRVCNDVIREGNLLGYDEELVNSIAIAALLHDVGKSQCKSGIIHKIIFVLLEPFYKKGILNWEVTTKYYEHGDISFTMVEKYDINKTALYLIKNHHNEEFSDRNLLLLRKCDDRN